MTRVLIVTPSGQPRGGSEEILRQFLRSCPAAGIEPYVVFLEDGAHLRAIQSEGFSCQLIIAGRLRNIVNWLKTAIQLFGMVRRLRPALVIGWQSKSVAYAGLACRLRSVPFACFHRGTPDHGLVDRLSFALPCDAYLANSEFTAVQVRQRTNRPVAVVHSAVDLTRTSAAREKSPVELKRTLGFDPNKPLIGIVGRLQRWKGIHVFVEAMAQVHRERPDCQGVIVGGVHDTEPAYLSELEELISRHQLKKTIRMAGRQDKPAEWMQAMDVVVHASDREPFGIVVIEAMSLGKPVVATEPGGPAEIVTHTKDGLLVRFGNASELSEAVLRFLGDVELRRSCGAAALLRGRQFDGSRYAERVMNAVVQNLGLDLDAYHTSHGQAPRTL